MKKSFMVALTLFIAPRILLSQNIGIGTNSPTEKLHVAGNIKADTVKSNGLKISSNAGIGKVLTSDATGNANWQSSGTAVAVGNTGFGVWGDCATNGNISEYNPVTDTVSDAYDYFGFSVSVSGNYAIVGAHRAQAYKGAASIYQYNGNNWVLMQRLTDATGVGGDVFGESVSISGNYAIVGAPLDDAAAIDQGSVSIYQFNGSSWVLMQKIIDVSGATLDYFGWSVSISGNFAIVGTGYDDVGSNSNQGSVIIYRYNGSSWVLMQKITDLVGAAEDYFGNAVSISGNYAIVGSYLDDEGFGIHQGSASIYQFNGINWAFMQKITTEISDGWLGKSVSISGNNAIVGGNEFANIYKYNGSSWVLMDHLSDASSFAFGNSVSISGNLAMVGAYRDDVGSNSEQGAVNIYLKVGTNWGKLQRITDPMGNPYDYFGNAISIDGITRRFLIGVYEYPNSIGNGKAVFGKVN